MVKIAPNIDTEDAARTLLGVRPILFGKAFLADSGECNDPADGWLVLKVLEDADRRRRA